MSVLHLWAIFGGIAAVGVPLLVHWLTKPRPVRMPLSTVRFVREVLQQRRARNRLRDFLVLLCRVAAVLLLAWAFARPLLGSRPLVAAASSGDSVRVVILDASHSMAASEKGITLFERGRAVAADYLNYAPGLRANLIIAGAKPRAVFEKPSSNLASLREELDHAKARPERLNLESLLAAASEQLARGGETARRELVIVSDFQRTNWATADFKDLPKDTLLQFRSVAPAQPLANLGVLRVGVAGRAEQERDVRLEVEVGNYSQTSRQVQVQVSLGDASWQLDGFCPAGVKTTLSKEVALPAAGWQAGMARLVGVDDALAGDNSRPFVIDVRPAATYAMVTREPSKPQPLSSHYLERALAPHKAAEGTRGERVVRVESGAVDRDSLTGVDVIVVDHPGKLSGEAINLLLWQLRRGRPVLYVAAEPIDATNLKLLADAAGGDMRMPVEFLPPAAGQSRRNLFLLEPRKDQAPFAVFGENLAAVTGGLKFGGGLSSRAMKEGLADDVLAMYSDRSACLVVTSCGAGMLAVLNADLTESNLPASGAFVPLVGELIGRLLADRKAEDALACGEKATALLPADAGAAGELSVDGGNAAAEDLGTFAQERGSVVWTCSAAGPPGVYQIKRNRDGATIYALATAIPAAESDLRLLDKDVLKDRLAGGRPAHYQGLDQEEEKKDHVWVWLLVACAGVLMSEVLVLRAFRG